MQVMGLRKLSPYIYCRSVATSLILGLSFMVAGQNYPKWDFHFPLTIETTVSGSFGEMRSNHFHSGIDFTTRQITGFPIYSIDEGYVSRIAVSPVGFGKAVYIDHPNGYTSVYAHCEWFSEEIDKLITELQYKNKSFAIDQSFQAGTIPVKRGELIAYSGNSGSSGGPHLHFEIRETKGQRPINPHFFDLPIRDEVAPVIEGIRVYPLDDNSTINGKNEPLYIPAVYYGGRYHLEGKLEISAGGIIGVGVQVIDYSSESWRRCGIYSIQLMVDNKMWFRSQMDGFFFHDTRYINSHIDYAFKQQTKKTVQKSFIDINNKLQLYTSTPERGQITMLPQHKHSLEYEIADAAGNISKLSFSIRGQERQSKPAVSAAPQVLKIDPASPYFVSMDNFKVRFPENAFYSEVAAMFELLPNEGLGIGSYFKVLNEDVPVHHFFDVTIPIPLEAIGMKGLTAAKVSKGKLSYAGGVVSNGNMQIRSRETGTFCLTSDTIPPSLRLLNIPPGRNYSDRDRITIEIKDDFSGIDEYYCTINGQWMLFEHDPKNNALIGYLKNLRIERGKKHLLELKVSDKLGNKASLNTEFVY